MIDEHRPVCFALQETHLKANSKAKLRRFSFTRKDNVVSERVCGGVGLLTSHDYPSTVLPLATSLQAVAIQANIKGLVSVISIYLPPNEAIDQRQLNELIEQLPEPFIIMGNFNGHSQLWGSRDTNPRGRQIEQMIEDHCLCLLNNGQDTYFHAPTRTFHALDLAICSPSLLPFCTFSVGDDPHNSDHFPIFVTFARAGMSPVVRPPNFIFERADWELFSSLAELTDEVVNDVPVDDAVKAITDIIIQAATASIPLTSAKPPKYSKPWWNQECQKTLRQQRKAWGHFRRYPTLPNLIAFKKAKANTRKIRRESKRNSWISYVSGITASTSSKRVWERVRKACGIYRDHSLSILEKDGRTISTAEEIANTLGETLQPSLMAAVIPQHFCLLSYMLKIFPLSSTLPTLSLTIANFPILN
ncbi:uncharacterized protein LOC118205796 [Stegodyphus dumicola]|uniref:uncharacterized protein LOC118205796 n=1 Tax=Stegodyphus dumicola TaxID=202533 RepID=UPI0015A966DE|nr:uncharacterized protein LOC118205796 [Stegodyphus dumicola]